MAVQSQVRQFSGDGIIGDFSRLSPRRVQNKELNSVVADRNKIGAATEQLAGSANDRSVSVDAGFAASLPFAGIIMNSKNQPRFGTNPGGSLADSLILADGTTVELALEGYLWVYLNLSLANSRANIGDLVYYTSDAPAYGELTAFSPTQNAPVGYKRVPAGKVVTQSATGTAVLTLAEIYLNDLNLDSNVTP